ncbi:hypothetical protein HYH02_003096 [Chlamydomonas schloesseri]|uniref:BTB domain-containing protein n=1 Tax=Chlamydomonas schloesseri TaxID=2026947 RepID=A0A836BAD0_9CHLO|nr:hypothetical protein HYH02_003096 [Chlamydomonas schloesseri]|eukprot:KAG2452060.1 hypothetical protein HYH02_003096 [Chlamydomonas schloesseri]
MYLFKSHALMRLVDDQMTLVAGRADESGDEDGAGPAARFGFGHLASDGAGSLYCGDGDRIRRIQLPAAWRANTLVVGHAGAAGNAGAQAGAGAGAGAGAAQVTVSTLPYDAPDDIKGLVFVPAGARQPQQQSSGSGQGGGSNISSVINVSSASNRSSASHVSSGSGSNRSSSGGGVGYLVFSTDSAIYRLPLPLPQPQPAAAGRRGGGGRAAAPAPLEPQLLAGSADAEEGYADGRGSEARLTNHSGLALDASGNIYLACTYNNGADGPERVRSGRVRRVSPDGTVTTLVTDLPHDRFWMSVILPNGYIALGALGSVPGEWELLLIDLGLTPLLPRQPAAGGAAPAGLPPPRSLPADLGALLDAQPDGTADLTIRVGERRFAVHRGVLSARCDYFKQRLAGDAFTDARAAELELPDADPDAFALLLRWLYTGGADVPSDQARSVAELADRLLLPELCAAAQGVVASSVTAGSVVDCLLWAWGCCESRGGTFGQLLARLKEWYVSHHEEVRRDAGPSRQRLAAAAPALTEELMDMLVDWERGNKRQRT